MPVFDPDAPRGKELDARDALDAEGTVTEATEQPVPESAPETASEPTPEVTGEPTEPTAADQSAAVAAFVKRATSNDGRVGAKPAVNTATDLLRLIVESRPGGEVRPQQQHMVELVEKAIKDKTHLLVQAGTGTGKSLGYLIPAIHSGKRIIVSTATKQLGEQIVNDDMPTLANLIPKVAGKSFTYALIKGRSNYACLREIDALVRLDEDGGEVEEALFDAPVRENSRRPSTDDLKKLNSLLKWADDTTTGDRSDAPAVPDRVWDQVSTDAASCAGSACPFYDDCFAEQARERARAADVVVTNHAQVAQDLRSPFPLLGEYEVLITDEVHELESYLSSAWGLEVSPNSMKHHTAQAVRKLPKGERNDYVQARQAGAKVLEDFDALADMLNEMKPGLCQDLPENVAGMLVDIAKKLRLLVDAFDLSSGEKGISQSLSADRKGACQKVTDLCQAIVAMCADMSDGTNVRWLEGGFGNRGPVLKVAPLWVGPQLMKLLGDKTIIATSATMTVGGSFDSFIRTLALTEAVIDDEGKEHAPRKFDAVDVGTPFDYDKQAILYIPGPNFPAPVGQEREAHTRAVLDDLTALVKAAGGRSLALFTTRKGAENAAAHLRANIDTPVLCQGDAPASQLIAEFKDDHATTLCATMGFWHGVNAPGDTCLLVILDKTPFAPMDDPLMAARRKAADEAGRSGFDEVFVAGASVMLSQGVGRLIRTASDKGVVAILDNRIRSKRYGSTMLKSMPQMRIFDNRTMIEGALSRLAAAAEENNPTNAPATVSKAREGANVKTAAKTAGTTVIPARKAAPRKSSTRALARNVKNT